MIEKSTFIQLKKRTVLMTALFVIHKCRREVKHVHVSLILEKYLLIRYGGSRTRTYEPYGVDLQSTAIATMRFPLVMVSIISLLIIQVNTNLIDIVKQYFIKFTDYVVYLYNV